MVSSGNVRLSALGVLTKSAPDAKMGGPSTKDNAFSSALWESLANNYYESTEPPTTLTPKVFAFGRILCVKSMTIRQTGHARNALSLILLRFWLKKIKI